MTVRGVVDVALQTDARFLEHGAARIDAPLLATVASVLDEISVEVSRERATNLVADQLLERAAGGRGTIKRQNDHLLPLRT